MLRYSLLTAGLMLGASAFASPVGDLPLMPWPAKVEHPATQGALVLTNQVAVKVSGDDLSDAVTRLRDRIALQTGWTLQPQPANPDKPTITITVARKVDALPKPDSDESYKLTVNANGVAITANTRFGALRAMDTLLQLVQNGGSLLKMRRASPGVACCSTLPVTLFRWRRSNVRSTAWRRRNLTCCTGTSPTIRAGALPRSVIQS